MYKVYLNLKKLAEYMPYRKDGVHRMIILFKINTLGEVSDIKVRSASKRPEVKEEIEKALSKLPVLIPATQNAKAVNLFFSLPIVYRTDNQASLKSPFGSSNNDSFGNTTNY